MNMYPNTLPYNLKNISNPRMRETLQFMKENKLNPVPLDYNTQKPLVDINYLYDEPIKKEHARLFLREQINVGIIPQYNNIVLIRSSIETTPLCLNTTMIRNGLKSGYSYIYYTDNPFSKTFMVNEFSIEIIHKDFIMLPPSKPHKWGSMIKPAFVKADDLDKRITELAELLQTM